MKRVLGIVLVLSIAVFCCACSSQHEKDGVPDSILENYIYEEFSGEDYHYTATHDVNRDSHCDTVLIEVTVYEEYCWDYYTAELVYRYDKSNDWWSLYESDIFHLQEDRREYHAERFEGVWPKDGSSSYQADILEVDFDNLTVTGSFWVDCGISINHTATLNASGTFDICESFDDYYGEKYYVAIKEGRYIFEFWFNSQYGIELKIYDVINGWYV